MVGCGVQALELAEAAHAASSLSVAAENVLRTIAAGIYANGLALTVWNPITRTSHAVSAFGFDEVVVNYLCSPKFLEEDVGYKVLVNTPSIRGVTWRDIEGNYAETYSATNIFKPAGILGGASVRLTTSDGRYTGDIHIGTNGVEVPNDATMAALRSATPLLAAATDLTRRLTHMLPEPAHRTGSGAVVDLTGRVVPLPDWPTPELFRIDPLVVGLIVKWRRHSAAQQAAFHHLSGKSWWRLRLIRISEGVLAEAVPTVIPYGLTVRGMQMLTMLALGMHNIAIAHRLGISERTCAHHIENLLAKLGVNNRTAAAKRAFDEGLQMLR